jgi:hypothetical protein
MRKKYMHSFEMKEKNRRALQELFSQDFALAFEVEAESHQRSQAMGYAEFEELLRKRYSLTAVEATRIRRLFRRIPWGEGEKRKPE